MKRRACVGVSACVFVSLQSSCLFVLRFLVFLSSFMTARPAVVAAQLESSASSPFLFLPQSLGKIDKPAHTA